MEQWVSKQRTSKELAYDYQPFDSHILFKQVFFSKHYIF